MEQVCADGRAHIAQLEHASSMCVVEGEKRNKEEDGERKKKKAKLTYSLHFEMFNTVDFLAHV